MLDEPPLPSPSPSPPPPPPPAGRSIVLFGILIEGSLAGLAWVLGWVVGQPPLEHCEADWNSVLLGVVAALPLLVVFVVSQRSRWAPFARIRKFFDDVLRPLFADASLLDLALISLAAGVGEEMLFRGVIQAALARWLGTAAGVALASVLFGLLHPITPTYALIAGAMGAYLGLIWLGTGNLLVAIVAHALYDFLALALFLHAPGTARRELKTDVASEVPPA